MKSFESRKIASRLPDYIDRLDGVFPFPSVAERFTGEARNFLVAFAELEVKADVDFGVGVSFIVVTRDVNRSRYTRDEMRGHSQLLSRNVARHVPNVNVKIKL